MISHTRSRIFVYEALLHQFCVLIILRSVVIIHVQFSCSCLPASVCYNHFNSHFSEGYFRILWSQKVELEHRQEYGCHKILALLLAIVYIVGWCHWEVHSRNLNWKQMQSILQIYVTSDKNSDQFQLGSEFRLLEFKVRNSDQTIRLDGIEFPRVWLYKQWIFGLFTL